MRDNSRCVFHAGSAPTPDFDRGGVFEFNRHTGVVTRLHDSEMNELAANAEIWAGVRAGRTYFFPSGLIVENAGQPYLTRRGRWIVNDGTRFEPSICDIGDSGLVAEAWGDGGGRIYGRVGNSLVTEWTVAGPEAHARVFDTPDGPYLCCGAGPGYPELRVRKAGENVTRGWRNRLGENRTQHPDVVCLGRTIKVVCHDDAGREIPWSVTLDDEMVSFESTQPEPQPEPEPEPQPEPEPEPQPEPEPAPMETTPNFEAYVRRRWDELKMSDVGRSYQPRWDSADEAEKKRIMDDELGPKHAVFTFKVADELHMGKGGAVPGTVYLLRKGGTSHRERSMDFLLVQPLRDGQPVPKKHASIKIIGQTGAPHAFPIWDVAGWNTNWQDAEVPFTDYRDGEPEPEPEPHPDPLPDETERLRIRVRVLERENADLRFQLSQRKPQPSYDDMASLIDEARAAYRRGVLGRQQDDMPAMTTLHLFYRWAFENFTREALIEEARKRGNNEPFD